MQFTPSRIPGAWVIDISPIRDQRGFFAMTWLPEEFRKHGIEPALAQCNLAFNHQRGTLRGMHFQKSPHAQAKIVRATRGALLDVIVDLRPESPTYRQWDAVELTADNRRMLYMPEGDRPRLSHADRRCGGLLPRVGAVGAAGRVGRAVERSRVRDQLAVRAGGDFGERSELATAAVTASNTSSTVIDCMQTLLLHGESR